MLHIIRGPFPADSTVTLYQT